MNNFTLFNKAILCAITLLLFSNSYSQEIDIIGNGNSIADGETNTTTNDFTDFGASTSRSFTIDNSQGTNNTTLTVTSIDLTNTTDFNISVNPTTVGIGKNGPNATFTISLITSDEGEYTSTVTVTSDATNDGGDGYTFNIKAVVSPEINIQGNGIDISNGDATPTSSDNTDFGSIPVNTTTSKTFNIQNLGSANLSLTDASPYITISGTDASDFDVDLIPSSTISGSSNSNFSIEFSPTTAGVKNATLTISNNDSNASSYTFDIRGTSIEPSPEIEVQGNGQDIINGDLYPSTFNNTNFGSVDIGDTATKTYTISNTGTTDLSISNILLSNTVDFEIVSPFYSSPIITGNSTQFSIRYIGTAGKHSSTVTIENNDSDENSFSFVIRGSTRATGDTSLWSVTNITPDFTLDNPYEITYGPDNKLWISERVGKKIVTVDPSLGGSKTTILDLSAVVYQTAGQDGLMGFAIHPDLYADINTSNNFVYIAYTYNSSGRKLRIARYNYIAGTGLLDNGSATTIIDGIDASNDHNSGRMKIGSDLKIYYTIGDQGANQFGNACNPIRAQDLPTSPSDYGPYKGKVLRLNLDGSIPDGTDGEVANPTLSGVRSHVYSYGHRNTQGIIFGSNGKLYASEHGAKVDDELNIITAGKNYGWPHIAGYYDNLAYGYCNWSSTPGGCSSGGFSDHNCPSGVTSVPEFDSSNNTLLSNFQPPIGTYDSTTNYDPSGDWLTWPTVAPSSIDIYEAGLIPDWGQSLLVTTLKEGTIFRAKLNTTGDALVDITIDNKFEEFHSSNDRYRDITMDPDGITFYAITDSQGTTSGPSGSSSVTLANPGVIMKFQYIGPSPTTTYYVDADGDTYGDSADSGTPFASDPGAGYSLNNTDCDDTDANEFPGQTWYLDTDGDGYSDGSSTVSCNRPTDYYMASELTATSGDCDDSNPSINSPITYYVDADEDGFGSTTTADLCVTAAPTGYSTNNTDCDDTDANEFPGQTWYLDADGDGYSDGTSTVACNRPADYYMASELTATSGDCDDSNPSINSPITYYVDADEDGFGSTTTADLCVTAAPTGYSTNNTDCDDTDANEFPGQTWYLDADGDGYSDGTSTVACNRPTDYYMASELTATSGDCDDSNPSINSPITYYVDADEDGFGSTTTADLCVTAAPTGYSTNNTDCDDTDANEFPGQTWYLDADGDGYSDGTSTVACNRPADYYMASELTATSGDCDDSNPSINSPITYYVDADEDGFGSTTTADLCVTAAPTGYSTNNTDCDDTDANEFPGQTWYLDADGDGYSDGSSTVSCNRPTDYYMASELTATSGDCDDSNPSINSPITYYVDADEDGFGSTTTADLCVTAAPTGYSTNNTDCDDTDANEFPGQTWYLDADGDGYSDGTSTVACNRPADYYMASELTATSGDCDDSNPSINSPITYYVDADEDGFGSTTTADLCVTAAPTGYSTNNTDCDDTDANEFPGQTWYLDADGDGYSDGTSTVVCNRPTDYYMASELTATSGDCDDSNPSINSPITYYVDADEDGFGSTTTADLCLTAAPTGYSTNNTDCDDTDDTINPGKTEVSGNGMDDDCNPSTPDGTLGIDNFNLSNVSISPNPFNSQITIDVPLNLNNTEFSVKLFDLNGRKIFHKNYINNNGKITITRFNNLEQAPYIIKITNIKTGQNIVKRLIKY